MRVLIGATLLVVGGVLLVIGLVGAGIFRIIGTETGIERSTQNLVGSVIAVILIAVGWKMLRGKQNDSIGE